MTLPDRPGVTAVVLCGGTSVRMGGRDKTAAAMGAVTVLDHILDHLPEGWEVVCVGVERPTTRRVTWTREEPPLGGPAAGIATGAGLAQTAVTVVVAGDQPFAADAAQALVAALDEVDEGVDAVGLIDRTGRLQPLLAAYRTVALRRAFPLGTRDVSVHRTVASLRMTGIDAPSDRTLLDVDTPGDLERARLYHAS